MKPGAWHSLKNRADVKHAIALFSIVLLALVWTSIAVETHSEREEAIDAAIRQSSNLAIAYEEHVIRTLKALDAVAVFIRHEHDSHGAALDIAKFVSEGVVDQNLFSILSIVDERGDIVASSNRAAAVNYADRDFFRAQVPQSEGIYISKPVLGRVSGTWQVPISRRVDKADGSFGGVVVLSVDPGYFTRFYQKADLGAAGLVALVGLDGVSRARRVGQTVSFGDEMSASRLLQERARKAVGSFLDDTARDGIRRYVSYRTLGEYPLVVAVGTAEDEVFARFDQNRLRQYRIALLASAVIVVFSALLIVAVARQKRVAGALAEDIVERKRLEAELRELATTDMLTGLPNRRRFLTRLQEEHARLQRFDAMRAAVLMLDLDRFKSINDTYGHAAGDEVLRGFAQILRDHKRQIDTASRLGGEEFAIILPGATRESALEFAERLRREVAAARTTHEAETIAVTVSIGIAQMRADDKDGQAALARADAALYRAKQSGRNRVEIAADYGRAEC